MSSVPLGETGEQWSWDRRRSGLSDVWACRWFGGRPLRCLRGYRLGRARLDGGVWEVFRRWRVLAALGRRLREGLSRFLDPWGRSKTEGIWQPSGLGGCLVRVWMWGDVGMEKDETRMRRWRSRNCLLQMKSTWLPKAVIFEKREKRREGRKKRPKKGILMEFRKRPKVDQRHQHFRPVTLRWLVILFFLGVLFCFIYLLLVLY